MVDKLLVTPFETDGVWFLPEDPTRKIAGTLHYNPQRIQLHLLDAFKPLRGEVGAGDSFHTYPIVLGSSREGDAVTLLEVYRAGMSFNIGSGGLSQPERLLSSWLLVGAHVPPDFAYPEMSFRVPGLQIWLSQKVIHQSHTREEASGEIVFTYTVGGVRQETMTIPSIASSMEWYQQWQSKADPFSSIDVTVSGWVTIRPEKPQQISWFFKQLSKIVSMLAFISGTPMSPDCIKASTGNKTQTVYVLGTFGQSKLCPYVNTHEFFMLRSAMGVELVDVVNRWFEIYTKIEMPTELALSVLGSEKLWLHVEFLSLVQALEGFHRGLYDGNYIAEADYDAVKKILGEAIPVRLSPDHKDALRSRIRYGNQLSLRKRLDVLSHLIPQEQRRIIFGKDGKVPRSWIDTRNYYTHWDEELRPNVLNTQEMYDANIRMKVFLRVLYLKIMAIPDQAILKALRNHSENSQDLFQLNARELRKQGEENTESIITITEQPPSDEKQSQVN